METFIGFVVGYLVGAHEGKSGPERLKTSLNSILASDEVHRLIAQAMTAAEPVARRAGSAGLSSIGGIGGFGGSVVRQLISRAAGTHEDSRAA
jgi:hypothetical protein